MPVGYGFPSLDGTEKIIAEKATGSLDGTEKIIAEKATGIASIAVPVVTFTDPVNVEVGDFVHITLTLSCVRNAADFYGSGSVTINAGTAVLENNGLPDAGMGYGVLGVAIHGTQRINHTFSGTYKVASAGTIVTVSSSGFVTVGTSPVSQLSYLRVIISRPNL